MGLNPSGARPTPVAKGDSRDEGPAGDLHGVDDEGCQDQDEPQRLEEPPAPRCNSPDRRQSVDDGYVEVDAGDPVDGHLGHGQE
jgi:hypothetical protein